MELISIDAINESIGLYGFRSSNSVSEKIRDYITLLLRWNQRLSLTTVTDPVSIVKFHFGESIFAARIMKAEGNLLDVGSGAGFPGIPLAIALPTLAVTLIESNTKKATFLAEVIRDLALQGIQVFRGRMEDYVTSDDRRADYISARAIGKFEALLPWSRSKLSSSGKAILWVGGDDSTRIQGTSGWHWNAPVQIPLSQNRFLLVGSPTDSDR